MMNFAEEIGSSVYWMYFESLRKAPKARIRTPMSHMKKFVMQRKMRTQVE